VASINLSKITFITISDQLKPKTMFRPIKYSFFLLVFLSFYGCGQETTIAPWNFREAVTAAWFPATVPGNIHTDLMANDLLPDPFIGTNELEVQWVEEKDWEYHTTFLLSSKLMKNDHIDLIFEGLDTYADVYLNDSLILQANNMYIPWTIDVKNLIKADTNDLRIKFSSAVRIGQEKLEELPYLIPNANEIKPDGTRNSIFSRKAQYHFGWDWGPRLVGCGIWRDLKFKGWDNAKIENVKIDIEKAVGDTAVCLVSINAIAPGDSEIKADINIGGTKAITELISDEGNKLVYKVVIPDPKLWWPAGMGEQHLYDVNIDLLADGKKADNYQGKTGLREVELITEPDSIGTTFYIQVNGYPVFMKGSNYIPADFFNNRAAEKYERVIQDALDANMNTLRIWGGAIYENDEFYDLCDEKGILIWQDFMFACAMVPTQKEHLESIALEAKANVIRLHNHPSVVMWCGNNENLTAWHQWGWQDDFNLHGEDSIAVWSVYDTLTNHTLPAIVNEYGNGIYWGSSPQAGVNVVANNTAGDQHEWMVWFGQQPFSYFKENAGRYISEYGLQAFPDMSSIRKFDPSVDKWELETIPLNFRQRSSMAWIEPGFDGYDMMLFYLDLYYAKPDNLEEFVYLSQLSQALSLQVATESHRRNKPYTMGTLYWQIDDVWPTCSWATVDYFGKWKAGHYAVREANKPIIVSADLEETVLNIHVITDKIEAFDGQVQLTLKNFAGDIIKDTTVSCSIPELGNEIVHKMSLSELLDGNEGGEVFLEMILTNGDVVIDEGIHYFTKPKDLKLRQANIKVEIEGNQITLTSKKLAVGVYLTFGDMDGHFSDNYFDLIPGQSKTVTFDGNIEGVDLSSIITLMSLVDVL
jgi:beta-mannosidase